MDIQPITHKDNKKLTIYFSNSEAIEKLTKAYEAYVRKYDGLATTKNRFLGALLLEGITHYMKDNSIAWVVR
jgi:hypothetical protein